MEQSSHAGHKMVGVVSCRVVDGRGRTADQQSGIGRERADRERQRDRVTDWIEQFDRGHGDYTANTLRALFTADQERSTGSLMIKINLMFGFIR